MEAARAVASTDMPVGDDGDASFGDLIAGTGPSTEEEASASLRDLAVRQAVANLPDRERDVIELRFGLVGEGPASLESIGKQLGLNARARPPDRDRGPAQARAERRPR